MKVKPVLAGAMLGAALTFPISAIAEGSNDVARYRKVEGPGSAPPRVVLQSSGWTEDSVATWDLKAFEPGVKIVLKARIP